MIDALGSFALATLLSPLLAAIAVWIRFDTPGPVLFWDTRVGKDGRPFQMAKFRTMLHKPDRGDRKLSPGDSRITAAGSWLRRWSLDELPQLWNVLVGEMSLIGPRPMLPLHLEHLDARQRGRLRVRPGITGWAQVNGRNDIPWDQRIQLDLEYIERYSLWLDARIARRTLSIVLRGSGIYSELQGRDAL